MMKEMRSLGLRYEGGRLFVLDQQRLPDEEVWISCESPAQMAGLIRDLNVRGAPLIGVAAALSLAHDAEAGATAEAILEGAKVLRAARPTAVNLMWAVDRMISARNREPGGVSVLATEAETIFDEDVVLCEQIASNGTGLFADGDGILTHCNTGGLATAGVGTALGVIRRVFSEGKRIHVYVDETRPLLQGARLTAWELQRLGIAFTLICDNMAAALMREGRIHKVIVGADRIAANGDVANKIGTYGVAVLASHHKIPFYVAAPSSTVDLACPSGKSIPIEQRDPEEVRGASGSFGSVRWSPAQSLVYNPAFDVTPVDLITGIILDRGYLSRAALKEGRLLPKR